MGRRMAAIGMATAVGIGGLAVAAVNPLGGAGAQTGTTTSTSAPAGARHAGDRALRVLDRALDRLVAEGTLTQEQADKVVAATRAEAGATRDRRAERRELAVDTAATALGTTADQVRAGVRAGTSIAEQADAAGVPRSKVADALATAFGERIDQALQDGTITQDQATALRGRLDAFVDRIMNADGSHRSGRRHGR